VSNFADVYLFMQFIEKFLNRDAQEINALPLAAESSVLSRDAA
jgi:hypothetical protein